MGFGVATPPAGSAAVLFATALPKNGRLYRMVVGNAGASTAYLSPTISAAPFGIPVPAKSSVAFTFDGQTALYVSAEAAQSSANVSYFSSVEKAI